MSATAIVEETVCPYPGLRPFRETESHLFFGREDQTKQLLRRLERNKFLALLGTSGSGKSSLINAGLIPALRGDYLVGARSRWVIVTLRPGADPLGRLAENLGGVGGLDAGDRTKLRESSLAIVKALDSCIAAGRWNADSNLLVIVDQFEEMFRYAAATPGTDWDERSTFVKLLVEAGRASSLPLYVVLSMRSEYLGDCAQFRDLPESINEGQYLIPRLTREHWRAAIERPARLMGVNFAPALVQQLLNDVTRLEGTAGGMSARTGDDADSLPLLQHALKRTWLCFEKKAQASAPLQEVSLDCYNEVGGIEGALSRHLDEACADAIEQLREDGERIARRMFQRLRVRDAKGREARDPLLFEELCAVVDAPPPQVTAVIDCFRGSDRSFVTPDASLPLTPAAEIDVVHECLLRRWTTLRVWVREEDESRRIYLRLARKMDDKDPPRGVGLQEAREWWDTRRPSAAWAKRYDPRFEEIERFLQASVAEEERARSEEAAKAEQERRRQEHDATQRRRLIGVAALAVAAAIAAVLLWIGNSAITSQRNNATRNWNDAVRNWNLAFAQLLAAKAQLAFADPAVPRQTAALLAATSVKFSTDHQQPAPIESRTVLSTALSWMPRPLPPIRTAGAVFAVAIAPGAHLLAAATEDGSVAVAGPDGAIVHRLAPQGDSLFDISMSHDGRYLVRVGSSAEHAVEIWDLRYGAQVDLPPQARVGRLSCPLAPDGPAALLPRSSTLLVTCGQLMEWNAAAWRAGRPGRPVDWARRFHQVSVLAFDARGNRVAVGGPRTDSGSNELLVYDTARQAIVRTIALSAPGRLTSAVFAGDGDNRIAIADDSWFVRVWPLDSNGPFTTLLHDKRVAGVHPSPDGRSILTVTSDGIARLWDPEGRVQSQLSLGRDVALTTFDWATHQLGGAVDGAPDMLRWTLWDPDQRRPVPLTGFSTPFRAVAGDRVFLVSDDMTTIGALEPDGRIRNVPLGSRVTAVAVSEDGAAIAGLLAASGNPELVLLSANGSGGYRVSWRLRLPDTDYHGSPRTAVRLSTDGRSVMAMRAPWPWDAVKVTTVDVFDLSGRLRSTSRFPVDEAPRVMQFTSDRHVLVRTAGGEILDWDTGDGRTRSIAKQATQAVVGRNGNVIAIAEGRVGTDGRAGGVLRVLRWPDLAQLGGPWPVEGVTRLAFNGDESALASGSADGTIRVWDPRSGDEVSRILFDEPLSALAFTTDGSRLIAVGRTQAARYLWRLGDVMDEVCRRAGRELTPQEWEMYVPAAFRGTAQPYRGVCGGQRPN